MQNNAWHSFVMRACGNSANGHALACSFRSLLFALAADLTVNERRLDVEILFLRMIDLALMIVRIVTGVHMRIVRQALVLVAAAVRVTVVSASRVRVTVIFLCVVVERMMRLVRFVLLFLLRVAAVRMRVTVITAAAQSVRMTVTALHCTRRQTTQQRQSECELQIEHVFPIVASRAPCV